MAGRVILALGFGGLMGCSKRLGWVRFRFYIMNGLVDPVSSLGLSKLSQGPKLYKLQNLGTESDFCSKFLPRVFVDNLLNHEGPLMIFL